MRGGASSEKDSRRAMVRRQEPGGGADREGCGMTGPRPDRDVGPGGRQSVIYHEPRPPPGPDK